MSRGRPLVLVAIQHEHYMTASNLFGERVDKQLVRSFHDVKSAGGGSPHQTRLRN